MIRKSILGHGIRNKGKNPFFLGMRSIFDLLGKEKGGFDIEQFRTNMLARRLRNSLGSDFGYLAHCLNTAMDQYNDQNREQ